MKKSEKYMSNEDFNLLLESLNQALQYERGERNDLRVTVVVPPQRTEAKAAPTKKSLKQVIAGELESLNKADLKQVADYVAFLKFQGRSKFAPAEEHAAARSLAV